MKTNRILYPESHYELAMAMERIKLRCPKWS